MGGILAYELYEVDRDFRRDGEPPMTWSLAWFFAKRRLATLVFGEVWVDEYESRENDRFLVDLFRTIAPESKATDDVALQIVREAMGEEARRLGLLNE